MKKGHRGPTGFCECGCGLPKSINYNKNGINKGYIGRYAPDCNHRHGRGLRNTQKGMNHPRAKPMFSRRIHKERATDYWMIKVSASGRWMYEHRWIMEQSIGRRLRRDEHVHHLNGNGLDNNPANLVVLSHSEHARITGGFKKWDRSKPHKCPLCGRVH